MSSVDDNSCSAMSHGICNNRKGFLFDETIHFC